MPMRQILFQSAAFMAGFLLVDFYKGGLARVEEYWFASFLAALVASLLIYLVSRLRSAQAYPTDKAV